jgi:hypothetical protein
MRHVGDNRAIPHLTRRERPRHSVPLDDFTRVRATSSAEQNEMANNSGSVTISFSWPFRIFPAPGQTVEMPSKLMMPVRSRSAALDEPRFRRPHASEYPV